MNDKLKQSIAYSLCSSLLYRLNIVTTHDLRVVFFFVGGAYLTPKPHVMFTIPERSADVGG